MKKLSNNTIPKEAIEALNAGIRELSKSNLQIALKQLTIAHHLRKNWIEPILALTEIQLAKPNTIEQKKWELIQSKLYKLARQKEPRALFLLARLAIEGGDILKAKNLLKKTIELAPQLQIAKQSLAVILLEEENWQDAEKILRTIKPHGKEKANILSNLSIALLRQNRLNEALIKAKEAYNSASYTEKASIYVNLGSIYQEMGDETNAENYYKKSLELQPIQKNALLNLGVLAYQKKDLINSESYYRKCLKIESDNIKCHVNLAGVLLHQGRFEDGWLHYERRLDASHKIMDIPSKLKRWNGDSIEGHLLLVHEQGLGDTFQFIRYAKFLKNMGIFCHFQGPDKLHELLLQSGLILSCCTNAHLPPSECSDWIPMMSIPGALYKNQNTHVAGETPYLIIDKYLSKQWELKLKSKKKLKIALHWQGNPDHEFTTSRGRSFTLETLAPLTSLSDIEWISLQKGSGSEQQANGSFANRWHPMQRIIDETWDFRQTAAILSTCDGLISSDSGIAHLAGACGIKVWMLLPWLSEWRWGLTGERTTWYKNHILLRQINKNDWSFPVSDLRHRLMNQTG